MAKTFENTTLGAADVYIAGVDIGLQPGPIVYTYAPTMLAQKVGVPLREEGAIVVEEESTLEFPVLEFSIANLAAILGRSATVIAGGLADRLNFGGAVTLAEVQVQAIHTNPRFGWRETVIIPRARTDGRFSLTWDSTAQKYRAINARFIARASAVAAWANLKLGCYVKERLEGAGLVVAVLSPGASPPS